MDKLSIRKEIGALINSIKEHSDNIGDKEHIPQLELELLLHKIEKLYQKSIVYNHLQSFSNSNVVDNVEEKIVAPSEKDVPKVVVPIQESVKTVEIIEKPIDLLISVIAGF